MRFHQGLELQGQLGEKVACAAGVIDGLWRCGTALNERRQRQAHHDEAADWHGREELPFTLLDALVEETLEHIAEKLVVAMRVGQANVLPHLQDL